ncbi:MAG: gliding motility protein GldM [Tannerella sp.]|jgi:gliding motility-associated protein GldM|nr:gliding motility protein GldM [Tannerella sp.]
MAGVSSNPNSPRQKMINLMYLVFIAMMALNVSSEVLDGFELVENSLRVSTENSTRRNEQVKDHLDRAYEANAAKVGEWYNKGVDVKKQSDGLFDYINELKLRIVQEADGEEGNINDVRQKDNLEAASRVMLAPVVGEGKKLKERLASYCDNMSELVGDTSKRAMFKSLLSTEVPKKAGIIPGSWEVALFENMPVSAAITLLTKMQNDIRYVEGEVLSTLITNVDVDDYRVNKIEAFVIPKSQIVTSGMPYEAELALAAVDSTKQPQYYLGETLLAGNRISIPTSGVGDRSLSGKIVAEGQTYTYNAEYFVTESSATIAPTRMNFLYTSIENDIEVAMAGVPSGSVRPSVSSGRVDHKDKNIWTITGLDADVSPNVTVTLRANVNGRDIIESKGFVVRKLPPPLPFLSYKDADGNVRKFTGGPIAKRYLVEAAGVQAAIDDGVLNEPHTVTGFTMTIVDGMGNYIPEVSNSGEFTQRQKDYIRNIARGKRFYIGQVKALDPAGKPVSVTYSMEIIVN